jgi:hypothetical protein
VKYWEIIADNLSKSALDSEGQTIWIADAHRDDGKRFIVRADEKLTAFLELDPRSGFEIRSLAQSRSRKPSKTANISTPRV